MDSSRRHWTVFFFLAAAFALPLRWSEGLAHPIVLAPAAIDGLFCLGFVWFLVKRPAAHP
jgi:hypothetical protein